MANTMATLCSLSLLLAAHHGEPWNCVKISNQKAARWRKRFLHLDLAGLVKDAPRPGRKPAISANVKEELIRRTTQSKPANATHWSTRTMAAEMGVSEATVRASGTPTG
jgi:hypothetical protein